MNQFYIVVIDSQRERNRGLKSSVPLDPLQMLAEVFVYFRQISATFLFQARKCYIKHTKRTGTSSLKGWRPAKVG